jgi:cyclophilin family peptidyl-prolyl cis-trans isomerase
MVAELYAREAPITVQNFKQLAMNGFYIGLDSHRMVPGFMLQLGKPTDPAKAEVLQPIKGEFSETLKHYEGVLSMARAQDDPDSATSQFFICFYNGRTPSLERLDGEYAVFGRLIEGYDVLRLIELVRVQPNPQMRGEVSLPAETITIQNLSVIGATVPPHMTAPNNVNRLVDLGNRIVLAASEPSARQRLIDELPGHLLSARDMLGLLRLKEGTSRILGALTTHQKYLESLPPRDKLVADLTANMTANAGVLVKPVGNDPNWLVPNSGERLLRSWAGEIPLPIYRLILPTEGPYQQLSFIWLGGVWRWLGPIEQWLGDGE